MNLKNILILLPVLNIMIDILFSFESIKPSLIMIRGIILFLLFLYGFFRYFSQIWKLNIFIILIILYFSIQMLRVSDLTIALPGFIKFSSSIIMFPLYFCVFKNKSDFLKLISSFKIMSYLFIINFILSNYLKLGIDVYDRDYSQFSSGNIYASILYVSYILLILAPIASSQKISRFNKLFTFAIYIIIVILILVSLRRTAILAIIISYTIFSFLYRKKNIIVKRILQLLLVVLAMYPYILPTIESRLALRQDQFDMAIIEKEGRFLESFLVWGDILRFSDNNFSLFGMELFNSAGKYGIDSATRQLHVDYNIIAHGSGLVGIVLYLLLLLRIFILFNKTRIKQYHDNFSQLIWTIGISLLITSTIISFSSGLLAVTYRLSLFAVLGAIHGVLSYNRYNEQ